MPKMTVNVDFQDDAEVDKVVTIIPLAKAGVCVNCERVFTILPDQDVCPGCGSVAWGRVKPWLNHGEKKRDDYQEVVA